MAASPEPDETATSAQGISMLSQQRRVGRELLAEIVFRPPAELLVRGLVRLRVSPTSVVLANGFAGLAAAAAIAGGELVAGALLLQLKTLLDNADGRLARVSGRTSALGRYLDTELDLVVNAVVLSAIADETGLPLLAAVALVMLTLVLSADFNEDVLHRRARGETVVTEPSAAHEGALARMLAALYRIVFRPQDRALQAFALHRFERSLGSVADPDVQARGTLAYHDGVTATVLANFGLSTQLAVLGLCLVLGVPVVYLWLVLACAFALVPLQFRRERAARRALRSTRPGR